MNFFHDVDRQRRRLITVFEGNVTLGDALQHVGRRAVHDTSDYTQLIDTTHSRVMFTPAETNRFTREMKEHEVNSVVGPTAFLVGNDADYGMYQRLGSMADPMFPVNVFRSWEAAKEWLGWANDEEMDAAILFMDAVRRGG